MAAKASCPRNPAALARRRDRLRENNLKKMARMAMVLAWASVVFTVSLLGSAGVAHARVQFSYGLFYDGMSADDVPTAMKVDGEGNVIVTGASWDGLPVARYI
jgi:hypothetical protein